MSTHPDKKLTERQYLEIERQSATRSEYFAGEVFAMSGASRFHNLISGNLHVLIHQAFKNRPCEVYQSGMRVKVAATGLYTYPDVVAACDPQFEDAKVDTLLNPQVIVEVSSPSTATYDRTSKFEHYQNLQSLQEYLLISQQRVLVEKYVRQTDGTWIYWVGRNRTAVLDLSSIACHVQLDEIYSRVDVDDADDDLSIVREPESGYQVPPRPPHPSRKSLRVENRL